MSSDIGIHPFRIEIPEADLDGLNDRLSRTRFPGELPGVGWDYGVSLDYLKELVEYWRTSYDWREREARLNEFPQFTTTIDGQNIHFFHIRSPEPEALPLIVTHGWPSSPAEFLRILGPLTDPRAHGGDPSDAFHVVAPSIPGFGFSGPTHETGWGVERVASAWAELMSRLGYDRYGAQGGDFGSMISPELGRLDTEHVVGVHVNALALASVAADPSDLETLSDEERECAETQGYEWEARSGYATMNATRPQTVAYALNDSPAGQLAWNLEWYVDYDPTRTRQTAVDNDDLLTSVSILWLTETAGSAARIYSEGGEEAWGVRPEPAPVPTGVANFPGDGAIRGLAERSNNVVHWSEFERGGHFASLQAPDLLVGDVRNFFRGLR